MNSTNTFGAFTSDFETHVAGLAPSSTPRVTHDPELHAFFLTPTNNISRVIEFSSAFAAVKDAALIVLEHFLIRLNTNSEWLSS